jgi:hypothetical protein
LVVNVVKDSGEVVPLTWIEPGLLVAVTLVIG